MQILLYTCNYHPEPIGIAPLMTELAEGLARCGHSVRVVTAMPNYPEREIYPGYRGRLYERESRKGVEIERCFVAVWPKSGLLGRALFEISFSMLSCLKALIGPRPDVVLSTSPSLLASLSVALVGTIRRCPTVLNLQDILPEAAIKTGQLRNPLAIMLFKRLEKFAYTRAAKISVIDPSFVRSLLTKGVDQQKLACIPNWVNIRFVRPLEKSANALRHRHRLQGKFVVLYAGNIAQTQGIETVIYSAAQMRRNPSIQFVIVGEKSQLKDLSGLCQDLGVWNVLLLPFVHRTQLPRLLAAADVSLVIQKQTSVGFNLPSKIPVIMASGRPLIAAVPTVGASAEMVIKSGGGLVVAPESPTALSQAIQKLCDSPQLVEEMGMQGRQFAVRHYSLGQAVRAYEALLKSAIEERKRAGASTSQRSVVSSRAEPGVVALAEATVSSVVEQHSA